MTRAVSLALVIGGVLLLYFGGQSLHSFGNEVSKLFTGSPTSKTIWLLVGGAGRDRRGPDRARGVGPAVSPPAPAPRAGLSAIRPRAWTPIGYPAAAHCARHGRYRQAKTSRHR